MTKYLLGIDAGGTSTRATLTDSKRSIISTGMSGPSNTQYGADHVVKQIQIAADQAYQAIGPDRAYQQTALCIGIAGYGRSQVVEAIRNSDFIRSFQHNIIVEDAEIANTGAHLGQQGGIISIGTGTIAFGAVGDQRIRLGGYGFPISDQGGGAHLGLSAIQYAMQCLDYANLAGDSFAEEVLSSIGGASNTTHWLDCASPADYAKLAPIVVAHARARSPKAQTIMLQAAEHTKRLIDGLRQHGVRRVTLTGGLGNIVAEYLDNDLRESLSTLQGSPMDGALLLASANQCPDQDDNT